MGSDPNHECILRKPRSFYTVRSIYEYKGLVTIDCINTIVFAENVALGNCVRILKTQQEQEQQQQQKKHNKQTNINCEKLHSLFQALYRIK